MGKKVAAVHASQSKSVLRLSAALVCFLFVTYRSVDLFSQKKPTHDFVEPDALASLFTAKGASNCITIKRSFLRGKTKLRKLSERTQQLLLAIEKLDHETIAKAFHPRLEPHTLELKRELMNMRQAIGQNLEVSIFRAWALRSPAEEGGPRACDDDQVELSSHYGYPLQVGLWFQVLSERELARVYLSLVPKRGHWYIGAFRWKKWTHRGLNYRGYFNEAQHEMEKGHTLSALFLRKMANRFIEGNPSLRLQDIDLKKSLDVKIKEGLSAITQKAERYDSLISWASQSHAIELGVRAEISIVLDKNHKKGTAQNVCHFFLKEMHPQEHSPLIREAFCRVRTEKDPRVIFSVTKSGRASQS